MLVLLSAGIAPGLALLCYFYLRDQFEPEPILVVAKVFLYGALITLPVMFLQFILEREHLACFPPFRFAGGNLQVAVFGRYCVF
ncbi:hypothetical protein B4099_3148 [Heyndrickxia coagulans]|uniref:Uncharacterized protein n=1 Tax=Heyndrickxia coagulans TaxID=1398 RepID=A0A150KFB6_HEYCO|nr:hypothetical protein B4099_3148 [Heyndrickxia coagulans]